MFDIFEQPWTLLGCSVLFLFGILTYRSFLPEKRHWWQLLLPVLLAGAAFGVDLLVQTDLEKINAVINTCIKAIERESYSEIESIIADNYSDSYHNTKESLMIHCRQRLTPNLVEKHKKRALLIELSTPNATATLFTQMTFDKNSYVYQNYKSFFLTKVELHLQKQPDGTWLINRAEVLELDRQPVNWSHIK